MEKFPRLISACLAIFLVLTMGLAGCGDAKEAGGEAATGTVAAVTAATEAPKEPVTIQWWQFWDIGDEPTSIKATAIDQFMKDNPDIIVEATKLGWGDGFSRIQTAIGAGTAPDVLELGSTWVGAFSDVGALSDLSKLITPEIKDKFVNWNLGEKDGKIYAFPWGVGTRAMAVNYDLVAQAGLDIANFKTWNDLLAFAKAIKEKCGVPGFNINTGDPTGDYQFFGNFLYSAGGAMIVKKQVDGNEKEVAGVNTDESKKALKFLMDMKPYSSIDNNANAALAFENNKLGMYIVDATFTGAMKKDGAAVKNWGYEMIPANPETGKTYAFSGAEVLVIPEQSKNKEAGFKYLTYLADEATALEVCKLCNYGILPSTKTAGDLDIFKNPTDDSAKRVGKYIEIMKTNSTWAPPLNKSVEDIGMRISTMLQEIFLNNTPVDKATEDCEKDVSKLWLK